MPPSVNEPLINSTAKQLRLIANRVPEIAADLRQMADQLEGKETNEWRRKLPRSTTASRLTAFGNERVPRPTKLSDDSF